MNEAEEWYVRSANGKVYGPADRETLKVWAQEGRVDPTGFVSRDRRQWIPAQMMPELEMCWVVEAEPGKFFGPFNRAVVIRLATAGEIPKQANVYRRHFLPVDKDPEPVVVEKIVEKVVEKIVEKRVEVPVEKIVERIIEVEPPPRAAIVEAAQSPAEASLPPPQTGPFAKVDRARLAALEAAAQRELAQVARQQHNAAGLAGIFSRRKS